MGNLYKKYEYIFFQICDASKALLIALITTFTQYKTIRQYTDAYFNNSTSMESVTLVSIDVAHFMKIWSKFLFEVFGRRRALKVFYMACIGQLILCTSVDAARSLVRKLFMVCLSETDGSNFDSGNLTFCEISKKSLKQLITGLQTEYENLCVELEKKEIEEKKPKYDSDSDNDSDDILLDCRGKMKKIGEPNKWQVWALEIKKEVLDLISNDIGEHENAHYSVEVADKIVYECGTIPLWSCMFNNKFGNNFVKPNSSATVESQIRKVKHGVLEGKGTRLRIDEVVEKLMRYDDGLMRIVSDSDDIIRKEPTSINKTNLSGKSEFIAESDFNMTNDESNEIIMSAPLRGQNHSILHETCKRY